jgi:hypothetical protein
LSASIAAIADASTSSLACKALGRRVREVREQRKMDARVRIAEGMDLEALDQGPDALDRGDEGRNDPWCARIGHASAQIEPRQRSWAALIRWTTRV